MPGGGGGGGDGAEWVIKAHPDDYAAAAVAQPPTPVVPGPVQPGGTSPMDAAMAAFGAATDADLVSKNNDIVDSAADRAAAAADAAAKFPAEEADAASMFDALGGQGMAEMFPQMASSAGGALAGVAGGILGSVAQIPQEAAQAGTQALQTGLGALQHASGAGLDSGSDGLDGLSDEDLLAGLGGGGSGADGGDGAGSSGGGTTPAGFLGPPPLPMSSPPTTPAGAPVKPVAAPVSNSAPQGPAPMGGMPMVPPAGMGGAGGGQGSGQGKVDEKRIAAPGVPNGQPVKGRMAMAPDVPVTKKKTGAPVVGVKRVADPAAER